MASFIFMSRRGSCWARHRSGAYAKKRVLTQNSGSAASRWGRDLFHRRLPPHLPPMPDSTIFFPLGLLVELVDGAAGGIHANWMAFPLQLPDQRLERQTGMPLLLADYPFDRCHRLTHLRGPAWCSRHLTFAVRRPAPACF